MKQRTVNSVNDLFDGKVYNLEEKGEHISDVESSDVLV